MQQFFITLVQIQITLEEMEMGLGVCIKPGRKVGVFFLHFFSQKNARLATLEIRVHSP